MKKKLVILTGSGISAESGLKTFRDSNGLWENYEISEVATTEGWLKNPQLVLDFYNARRKNAAEAAPNKAHYGLVELESFFDVHIITQNVDDLHERAGSSRVLHLHGKLNEAKSSNYPDLIIDVTGKNINLGDLCPLNSQLRPNIVWFGEEVPEILNAADICSTAAIFVIIGTSLQVYPASGLIHEIPADCPIFILDPDFDSSTVPLRVTIIPKSAVNGINDLKTQLLNL